MDVNAPEFTSLSQQFGEASISGHQDISAHNAMAFEPALANYRPDYVFRKYVFADIGSAHARSIPPPSVPVNCIAFDREEGEAKKCAAKTRLLIQF